MSNLRKHITRWAVTALFCFGFAFSGDLSSVVHAQQKPNLPIQLTLADKGFLPGRVYGQTGHPVTINIVNRGSKAHEFSIPYYYVFTRNLNPGERTSVSFTPSTSGTFDMMSDPDGTNQPEYKGVFIVTADK